MGCGQSGGAAMSEESICIDIISSPPQASSGVAPIRATAAFLPLRFDSSAWNADASADEISVPLAGSGFSFFGYWRFRSSPPHRLLPPDRHLRTCELVRRPCARPVAWGHALTGKSHLQKIK